MQEFDSVSVSSYEADTLSAQLTERSADGWDVVSIVPAGSEIIAFLSRPAAGDAVAATADEPDEPVETVQSTADAGALASAATATEPAGWASEPEASTSDSSWDSGGSGPDTSTTASEPAAAESTWNSGSGWATDTAAASEPAQAAGQTGSTPAVPAGWFTDPSNRYELRYWDGSAWTEHVAKGGQQFTDPPVA